MLLQSYRHPKPINLKGQITIWHFKSTKEWQQWGYSRIKNGCVNRSRNKNGLVTTGQGMTHGVTAPQWLKDLVEAPGCHTIPTRVSMARSIMPQAWDRKSHINTKIISYIYCTSTSDQRYSLTKTTSCNITRSFERCVCVCMIIYPEVWQMSRQNGFRSFCQISKCYT